MAVQEASDVEKSEQYANLSPKRQEIVDAWVDLYEEEGEEPKNVGVAELADANESYTSQTLTEHKDIARARVEQIDNERDEGEVTTEGDPFQGKLEEQNLQMQTIKERPHKGTKNVGGGEDAQEQMAGMSYEFSAEEIETIVVDEKVPETLQNTLEREVIHRAFGD